jgi:hypothetical protein
MAAVSGFGEEQDEAEMDGPVLLPAPTPLLSPATAHDDGSFEQAPAVAQAPADLEAVAVTEAPAVEAPVGDAPAVTRARAVAPREFNIPQLESASFPPVAAQLHFSPEPQPTAAPPPAALHVPPEPPAAPPPPSVQLHIAPEPEPTPAPPSQLHIAPEPEPTPAPPSQLHIAPEPDPTPAPPPADIAAAPGPVAPPPPAQSPVPAAPARQLTDPLAPLPELDVPEWLAVAGPSAFVKSPPQTRPTPPPIVASIAGSEDLDRAYDQKAPRPAGPPQVTTDVEPATPSNDRPPDARRAPIGVWSSSAAAAPRLAPRPAPNDGLPQTTRGRQGRPDEPWSGRSSARPTSDSPPPAAGQVQADDTIALPGRPRRPPPRQHDRGRSAASSSAGGRRAARAGRRRLSDPISAWRRLASVIELLLTTVVLGVLLAAVLAGAIGAIVVALQHALNG